MINDRIVNELKNIFDEKTELCLDEIVDELSNRKIFRSHFMRNVSTFCKFSIALTSRETK